MVKPWVRDAWGWGLAAARLTRPRRELYTAVTFHRVLPEALRRSYPLAPLAVTPEDLGWFLRFFRERYTCGPLDETFQRYSAGERPERPFLAVTFDDGQLDNYMYAKPELDRAGVKASFFIPVDAVESGRPLWHDRLAYAAHALHRADPATARRCFAEAGVAGNDPDPAGSAVIAAKALEPAERSAWVARVEAAVGGATEPSWDGLMAWDEIRALADEGHEIGSHSMSHALLPQLDAEAQEREVKESKAVLEARLDRPIASFCYPNGDCDAVTVAAVERAGYRQAVTTRWGPNRADAPRFELTRCDMQSETARSAVGRRSRSRTAWRLSPHFSLS